MIIQTRYHGETEILDKDILHFENGIPGFPNEKKFILLALPDQEHFTIMQSVKTSELAFVLTNPYNIVENYDITLDENTMEQLKLKKQEDVSVFSIVTVQDPFNQSTTNLQAPIVLNLTNRKAKQLILNESPYKIKQPLFQLAAKG